MSVRLHPLVCEGSAEERRRQYAIESRKHGKSLQEIADALGISRQAVHQMLKRAAAAVDRRNREG
jgi:predicted DNA-binding protein YlxM (UPF0122 family)